jgi:hypothetical protein
MNHVIHEFPLLFHVDIPHIRHWHLRVKIIWIIWLLFWWFWGLLFFFLFFFDEYACVRIWWLFCFKFFWWFLRYLLRRGFLFSKIFLAKLFFDSFLWLWLIRYIIVIREIRWIGDFFFDFRFWVFWFWFTYILRSCFFLEIIDLGIYIPPFRIIFFSFRCSIYFFWLRFGLFRRFRRWLLLLPLLDLG